MPSFLSTAEEDILFYPTEFTFSSFIIFFENVELFYLYSYENNERQHSAEVMLREPVCKITLLNIKIIHNIIVGIILYKNNNNNIINNDDGW